MTNWRVLFYLLFADVSVEARIEHYDTNMQFWRNILSPIIQGICLAIVMPDIKTLGAKIARRPSRELHDLQKSEASLRRIAALSLKAEEEDALDRANEARDRRKINEENRLKDAVKRDAEVKDKFAPEEAERLQSQIDELRERPAGIVMEQGRIGPDTDTNTSSGANSREDQLAENLGTLGTLIVFALGRVRRGNVNIETLPESDKFRSILGNNGYDYEGVRLTQEYLHAMNELERQEVLEVDLVDTRQINGKQKYTTARLTALGYKIYDKVSPKLLPPDQTENADKSE